MTSPLALLSQQHIKDKLQKEYHLSHLRLFGSYAHNTQTESSDIDILFEEKKGVSDPLLFIEAGEYLRKILKKPIHFGEVGGLHPSIRDNVLSSRISIW